jgi:hypothetical protein
VADLNPLAHRLYLADLERRARPAGRGRPRRAALRRLLASLARDLAVLARAVRLAAPARST